MSQIDWSKAPEGFPLWLEGMNEDQQRYSGWYRKKGFVYEGYSGGQWLGCREGQFFRVHRKPSHAPWDGEGPPPVGIVCEIRKRGMPRYSEAEICYISPTVVVWKWHGDLISPEQVEYAINPELMEFRPLRTAEQIAADARTAAIEEMVYGVCGCEPDGGNTSAFLICGIIYDGGYRKQAEK